VSRVAESRSTIANAKDDELDEDGLLPGEDGYNEDDEEDEEDEDEDDE
jgi:hypothetical protein